MISWFPSSKARQAGLKVFRPRAGSPAFEKKKKHTHTHTHTIFGCTQRSSWLEKTEDKDKAKCVVCKTTLACLRVLYEPGDVTQSLAGGSDTPGSVGSLAAVDVGTNEPGGPSGRNGAHSISFFFSPCMSAAQRCTDVPPHAP